MLISTWSLGNLICLAGGRDGRWRQEGLIGRWLVDGWAGTRCRPASELRHSFAALQCLRVLQDCCVNAITRTVNVLVISTLRGFEPESKADPDPQLELEPEWTCRLGSICS